MRRSPEYNSWAGMRQRCLNPNAPTFPYYGGRGITVAPAWSSFAAFLADVGPRPAPGYTLDRIDNAGPYEPGNVRWATKTQQARNRRPRRRRERCGADLHDLTPDNRTADGRCRACRAAASQAYRDEHSDRVAASRAKSDAASRARREAAIEREAA